MRKAVRAGHASEDGKNPEAINPSRQWPTTTRRIPKPLAISRDSSRRLSRGVARARVGWDEVKESVSPGIGSRRSYRFPVYMEVVNRLWNRKGARHLGMLLDGEGEASRIA